MCHVLVPRALTSAAHKNDCFAVFIDIKIKTGIVARLPYAILSSGFLVCMVSNNFYRRCMIGRAMIFHLPDHLHGNKKLFIYSFIHLFLLISAIDLDDVWHVFHSMRCLTHKFLRSEDWRFRGFRILNIPLDQFSSFSFWFCLKWVFYKPNLSYYRIDMPYYKLYL